MEIDYPSQQDTLPSSHAAVDISDHGVYKLDDFLSAHKAEHDAQILAREAANAAKHVLPRSKKVMADENVAPLMPVAVGARSSKHTIILHEKYQALGIPQPVFTYGGGSESGWTVEVSFPGIDVEELQGLCEERKFNSKQEAKEALCKRALEVLEEMEERGRITKAEKGKKQTGADGPVPQQEKKVKEPGPNYLGQLLEFQRSLSSPQPTYTDYRAGSRFACLVTIDGHANPFGSLDSLHSSKKAARQEAARHAVAYFQAQGQWPEDSTSVGGIKKKKAQPALTESATISTSTPSAETRKLSTTSTASTSIANNVSYAQQVAHLAVTLSLSTPEWCFNPHPVDKEFHTVSCFFRNGGPHEGPIGEVRNIFGKKKAKEECARLTLEYLNGVRAHRMRCGERMLEGISGSEGVVRGAVGRAVDGEKEAVAKWQGVVVACEASESEGDQFEDAVEAMGA
ncbi:uncharacterized protein K460DRAFT_373336 [Cucurbitaria berberidis CBS 394.84]|uniref:DRBM domain-containing protein n=1 Tax=Cucurbitaria berberidis CBS 394.84 TaxID=1168544 RepID=A0A9P4LDS0_9PLEO|nr:uncharacterized protein K460DRAFT_373336 [Cucurbitaria berberidis CBS 394.84]KAF1851300.1 hypothetical protein K460DRAFT_373336 [Cucurbitaria berberidis CBS 394.84]